MCLLKKNRLFRLAIQSTPASTFGMKVGRSAYLESLLNMPRLENCERFLLSEEEQFVDDEVDLVYEMPVFDILGDVYVCSNCGSRLTEIPAYNRFYCENCGLHY
jgi:hypothetical protein